MFRIVPFHRPNASHGRIYEIVATQLDGNPIPRSSTTFITLHFQVNGFLYEFITFHLVLVSHLLSTYGLSLGDFLVGQVMMERKYKDEIIELRQQIFQYEMARTTESQPISTPPKTDKPKRLPRQYRTKPCVFFTRDGGCKFGERCKYLHQPNATLVEHDDTAL